MRCIAKPTTDAALASGSSDPPARGMPSPYDDNGVDLSLIRANMKLTPEQRARRAERARKSALRVQQVGRALRRKPT
jgi:hypothetical protein